jgi:hypothetical protein
MDANWLRLREPEVWRWLFEDDVSFDEEQSFELALPCGEVHGLKAKIDEGTSVTLFDRETSTELGWLDDAHFHPNCLRAAEVLFVAASQDSQEKRRLATLLLLPFAVVTTESAAKAIRSHAQAAWTGIGLAGDCPGLHIPEFDDQLVEWHLDSRSRWCLRERATDLNARPLCTLRVEENPDFPAWLSRIGS